MAAIAGKSTPSPLESDVPRPTGGRKMALAAAVARKREALKADKKEKEEKRAADEKTFETWSGLRISNRCVRQEKWDLSMQGKALVPIANLGGGADPLGRDQVVIGVLRSTA